MMQRRVLGIPLPIVIGVVVVAVVVLALLIGWIVTNAAAIYDFIFRPATRNINVIECSESSGCRFWHPIIYSAILLFAVITGFAYTTLLERKFIAWFQHRVGPNRVGPWGLLQPAADGLKLVFKEDILPTQAYHWVYRMAPMIKAVPILLVLAVIPLGPPVVVPWFDGNWYRIPLVVADVGVAVLWLLAITSLGTYGIVLAGWSSNNKYSMLGALRASAQMISYELSLGVTLAVPIMIVGSMSLVDIAEAQGGLFINWLVFQNPLAAGILMIALIAETNRAPFDLPEAEQELTAGYMTEYSGMKFALFMMAEYLGMIAVSLIAAATFLGGYQDGFGLVDSLPILGPLVMLGKVVLLLIGYVWVRATLPRLRYDRLMMLGWKIMLPLSLVAVSWTAVAVVIGDALGQTAYMAVSTVLLVLVLLAGGWIVQRRDAVVEEEAEESEFDPVITGERGGPGYVVLQIIGGIVAIPFVLYEWTINVLEGLAALGTEPETEEEVDSQSPALPDDSRSDA